MAAYNTIAGASENAANNILGQLYTALAPSGLFEFSVNIDSAGFSKVEINIAEAPKTKLKPTLSSQIKEDVIREATSAKGGLGLDPADKAALASALDSVAKTTINVLFPVVKFRLYYSKPKAGGAQYIDLDAGLDVVVGIQLDTTQNPVAGTVKALSAVAILQDATVESIMNNAIIPTFLPDLNEKILKTMSIPTISVPNATLSVPVPVVDNGYLLAYASLGPYTPPIPASGKVWSGDSVFVCVDAQFLSTVLSPELRNNGIPRSTTSIGPLELYYEVEFSGIDTVNFGPDGDIIATARFAGKVGFKLHHGLPFFPEPAYSIDAYGKVGISAVTVIQNQKACVKINSIDQFTFDLDLTGSKPWGGMPFEGQIDKYIEDGRNKLVDEALKPKVMEILGGKWFTVSDVPAIPVELGSGFEIILSSVQTTRETFNGVQYLMAYGTPVIKQK